MNLEALLATLRFLPGEWEIALRCVYEAVISQHLIVDQELGHVHGRT